MLSSDELSILAEKIRNKIRLNFEYAHLSQNLINTIKVQKTTFGYEIDIPAEIYDLQRWVKENVVVYTGQGSYAQEVDVNGGFSRRHTNYVEKAIKEAISEWVSEMRYNVGKVDWL